MIKESTSRPVSSSLNDDGEPTEPRIPAQRLPTGPTKRVLRHNGAISYSIDEQGIVNLSIPGRAAISLKPELAFDLLDFLFEQRNFLAARSAEIAEQQGETHKECKQVKLRGSNKPL